MSKCKKLDKFSDIEKCLFCETSFVDELKYGSVYKYEDIVVHYFCLLLSSSMEQNGQDEDGIYGFLPHDIKKEAKRGKKLRCTVCRKAGATLGCSVAKCKTVFHLPCGISRGSLHQFYGQFKSFCVTHRPRQRISDDVLKKACLEPATCVICYDNVILNDDSTMWAPCCKKNAFFHRVCVQKLANSFGGYAFRCPLCNDQQIFTKAMKDFGIFVPDRDASWEQEENAFNELLYRHDRCDAQKCICPHGRKYNKKGMKWCIMLCHLCGSQGIHRGCRLQKTADWQCDNCLTMLHNAERESSSDGESNSVALRTSTSLERNWQNRESSFRLSDPCSSNNMSSITTAPIKITRRKVRRDEFSTSPSPPSSRSSSRSLSRSSSKSSVSDTKSQKHGPGSTKKENFRRSLSSSPSLRKQSSSSSSVVSVRGCPSPVIIIDSDSDEDLEIVADVSRSILVNREGNKIQIVQIVPEEESKAEKVVVQGDLNVKDVLLDLGVKMRTSDSSSPERPESIFKRRRKTNSSLSVASEGTPPIVLDSDTVIKSENRLKSISPSGTVSRKGLPSSSVNVENFYSKTCNPEVSISRVPNSTKINISDKSTKPSELSHTGVNVYRANDVLERNYQVYTPPNRGNLLIKTVESISTKTKSDVDNRTETEDLLARLPRETIVKIRDPKIEPVRTPRMEKYSCHSAAADSSYIDPSSFSWLQRYAKYRTSEHTNFYPLWNKFQQKQQQEEEQKRNNESSFGSRYNYLGLKELKVVLTPIMIKVVKNGSVKVVQRKLKNHISFEKNVPLNQLVPASIETVKVPNVNNSDKMLKTFYDKIVIDRRNLLLKSVYNSMANKNKENKCNNYSDSNRICNAADHNGRSKIESKSIRKPNGGTSNKCDKQRKVDDLFRSLLSKNEKAAINKLSVSRYKLAKSNSLKRKRKNEDSNDENSAVAPIKKRKLKKFDDCLADKSNLIPGDYKNLLTVSNDKIFKEKLSNKTIFNKKKSHDEKSHSRIMKQATLFDIFSNKNSVQSVEVNHDNKNEQRLLRKRQDLNYRNGRSYKRICIKDGIQRLHSLQSVYINPQKSTSTSLICNICHCDISSNVNFNKICCFMKAKSLSGQCSNFSDKSVDLYSSKDSTINNDPSFKVFLQPVVPSNNFDKISVTSKTTADSHKKTDLNQNLIYVQKAKVLPYNKEMNSAVNFFNNSKNCDGTDKSSPVQSNYPSDVELVTSINFPYGQLNSLRSPNCLKFTTYPVSKVLVGKILSSFVKIEIKKSVLTDMDCYQCFIFIEDLPVLCIKVRLNQISDSETVCTNNIETNWYTHFSMFYQKGELESYFARVDTPSPRNEVCVCYNFENSKPYNFTDFNSSNNDNIEDGDSFFIFPSLMSFSTINVNNNDVCLKLLMTVRKNNERKLVSKSFSFKNKEPIKNPVKRIKKKPTYFGQRRRKLKKPKTDKVTSCDNKSLQISEPALHEKNAGSVNEKNIIILNEEQKMAFDHDYCKDEIHKSHSKIYKDEELIKSLCKVEGVQDIKMKTEPVCCTNFYDFFFLGDNFSENTESGLSSNKSGSSPNKNSPNKRRVIKSPKKLTTIGHLQKNNFNLMDELSGKFGFNIKEYAINFHKNVYKYINTNNSCWNSNDDCAFFNYINKFGDDFINTTIGSNFKPSLIEEIISSLKSQSI